MQLHHVEPGAQLVFVRFRAGFSARVHSGSNIWFSGKLPVLQRPSTTGRVCSLTHWEQLDRRHVLGAVWTLHDTPPPPPLTQEALWLVRFTKWQRKLQNHPTTLSSRGEKRRSSPSRAAAAGQRPALSPV